MWFQCLQCAKFLKKRQNFVKTKLMLVLSSCFLFASEFKFIRLPSEELDFWFANSCLKIVFVTGELSPDSFDRASPAPNFSNLAFYKLKQCNSQKGQKNQVTLWILLKCPSRERHIVCHLSWTLQGHRVHDSWERTSIPNECRLAMHRKPFLIVSKVKLV